MNSDHPQMPPFPFKIHWEYILTALFLSGIVAIISSGIADSFPDPYSQFVVGSMTWESVSKPSDYALLFSFIISFFIIYTGLYFLSALVYRRNGESSERSLRQLLAYSLLPAVILSGKTIVNLKDFVDSTALEIVILSLLLVLFSIGLAGVVAIKRLKDLSAQSYLEMIGGSLLYVLFSLLVGSAFALAIGRVNLAWQLKGIESIAIVSGIGALLLWLPLLKIWQDRSLTVNTFTFRSKLRFMLWAVQGFFPLFFLVLLPAPWFIKHEKYYGHPITITLLLLVGGLLSVAYFSWFRRFKPVASSPDSSFPGSSSSEAESLFSVVSPLSLIAILLFIKSPSVGVSIISTDEYHLGEVLLPWWLSKTFHYIPFWDYEPSRGLVNYVPGLLADLFFDGSAAALTPGNPLYLLPYLSIGFLAISQTIGLFPAFLALLLMPNSNGLCEIDVIMTVCLCLLCNSFLKRQWCRWLIVWGATGLGLLLFTPGQAGLLLLAMLPLTAFALFQAVRKERQRLIYLASGGILLLGLLLGLTPLGKMLLGALRYAIEQSSINSVAYGIDWKLSRDTNPVLSYSLWEIVRTSWILVGLVAGLLLFRSRLDKAWAERSRYTVFAVPIVLLLILFIPRAAGRIDPGHLSRLGQTSLWAVCLLLPILLLTAFGQRRQASSLIVVAVLGGVLVGLPSGESVLGKSVQAIDVNSVSFVDGTQMGLSQLGQRVIIDPSQLARLRRIQRVLKAAVDPGETYLDLTNHGAEYFYLNYPPPIQASAFYNLPHRNQQIRAIERLDTAPPPIALVSADNILPDGASLPLRAHLLYRYVAERYIPVKIDGLIVMVRPDRLAQLKTCLATSSQSEPIQIGTTPATQLQLLDQAFQTEDLRKVPRSWGQSFNALKSDLQLVKELGDGINPVLRAVEKTGPTSYRVSGPNPQVSFNLANLNLNGRDAGILTFDFSSARNASAVLEVHWSSESIGGTGADQTGADQNAVIRFSTQKGKVVVPLDAFPRWLLAKGIRTLQIDVVNLAPGSTFSLAQVALFQRSTLPDVLKRKI